MAQNTDSGNGRFERFFWNRYAKCYDNLARHYIPYQSLVQEVCYHIDQYTAGRSINILDAGCGTGNYSIELSQRGHKVTGIDFSSAMFERAIRKKNKGAEWPKLLFHNLIQPLPFEDNSFDAIICIHVLYTIPDQLQFLKELCRVARRQSMIIIVNSSQPLSFQKAIKHQWNMTKGIQRFRTLLALASVGFWNIPISRRQQSGQYHTTTADELQKLLIKIGANEVRVNETYVGSVLGLGWWIKS